MPLDKNDLIFCVGTAPHIPLLERIDPAREAGFAAISVLPHERQQLKAAGISDVEFRARVADAGMAIGELDGLVNWLPNHTPPESFPAALAEAVAQQTAEELVPIAAAVGARSITVVEFFGTPTSLDDAAEGFAHVCDLAAEHDVLVHLEFLPWGGVPNLVSAAEVVRRAGRPNGGILVDSWHFFRSGSTFEQLRQLPGEAIMGVQIDDAPTQAEKDLLEETMHRRLFPGEGSFDLVGLIQTLDEIGCNSPIGIEVLSDDLAGESIENTTRRSAESMQKLLASARRVGNK